MNSNAYELSLTLIPGYEQNRNIKEHSRFKRIIYPTTLHHTYMTCSSNSYKQSAPCKIEYRERSLHRPNKIQVDKLIIQNSKGIIQRSSLALPYRLASPPLFSCTNTKGIKSHKGTMLRVHTNSSLIMSETYI